MAAEVEKNRTTLKTNSRSNEIIAVVLSALAVLIFLSLATYSSNDWSLNTSSSQKTQNWVGVLGSVIADLLFQIIGIGAYFLPLLLGLAAWRSFRSRDLFVSPLRLAGYLLFIVSFSSLAVFTGFRGGVLGAFFSRTLALLLGNIGAVILLAAFLAMAVLMLTNFSFGWVFDNFSMAWENFKLRFNLINVWINKYKEQREAKKAASAKSEKLSEAKTEKTSQKTPSFPTAETTASGIGKKESIGDKVSEFFNRFIPAANPAEEKSPAIVEEKQAQPELENKTITPTISFSKENFARQETATTPALIAETGNIPITPMRETGELDADLLENVEPEAVEEEKEEAAEQTKKPQNFDDYILPTSEFLTASPPRLEQKEDELLDVAQQLTDKTREFNVTGRVLNICQGPVVTTYEFKPDPGVKYSRVTGLSDDLCLALQAESIRIDRIPGKAVVGIEVPNNQRETIFLREVVESRKFRESNSLLTIALGKTIDGLNYIADLAKMPHLLIAGATGAGKSVGVNTLVVSILYKARPDEVKFIMVDPKRLELGLYADIPHLATPIITDPKRAAISLKWAVSEMEKRYKELAGWGVRNIDGFNAEVKKRNSNEHFNEQGEPWKTLPYIVIIIDELADLMMVSGKEVEESITRLAQMARAVGIHLVLATQRPSVDVITGLIKANFPARISFRVSSKVDSRTIIDANGSESLLGKGDMLFLPPATSQIVRVHGAFVDEKEIAKIVEHVKAQGSPEYDTTITKTEDELVDNGDLPGKKDALFIDALKTVVSSKRASTSLLQRHLRIGYGRAAAILDAMVHEGYIGEMDGSTRARPILQKAYDDLQEFEEGREL